MAFLQAFKVCTEWFYLSLQHEWQIEDGNTKELMNLPCVVPPRPLNETIACFNTNSEFDWRTTWSSKRKLEPVDFRNEHKNLLFFLLEGLTSIYYLDERLYWILVNS